MVHAGHRFISKAHPQIVEGIIAKDPRRRLRRCAVIADAVIIIGGFRSTGEQDQTAFIGPGSRRAIKGAAAMGRDLMPFNIGRIVGIDAPQPCLFHKAKAALA